MKRVPLGSRPSAPTRPLRPPPPLRTILVVDDDEDIRRALRLSLERIGGFSVVLAANAEQAVAEARHAPPDLVLLDVSMPGIDGPATLAALRAIRETERVPVVFCTAVSSEDEAVRLCALGALGVIAKPFDLIGLPVTVRAIFAKAAAEVE
jgi:two-component system, OmpR family, response regulator